MAHTGETQHKGQILRVWGQALNGRKEFGLCLPIKLLAPEVHVIEATEGPTIWEFQVYPPSK